MNDGFPINLVVDRHPPQDACFENWSVTTVGYKSEGIGEIDCLLDVTNRMSTATIEWRLIRASMEERQDNLYPKTQLTAQMQNMLRFEHYYVQALTLVVLGGFVPKTVPLGPLELQGLPMSPKQSDELLIFDPFIIRDREQSLVLVRTRVQLRANRDFFLGLGRQGERELSMLSARFNRVGNG